MQIVDFILDSYQEYEDKHSIVLFSKGCNFKCKDCYNIDTVSTRKSIGNAIEILDKNVTPLHEAVVFLGGEPTIWGESLIESVIHAKGKGLETKVYSNGSYPDIVRALCKAGVDAFSFDYKSVDNVSETVGVNLSNDRYRQLLHKSIDTAIEHGVGLELRTTVFQHTDIEKVRDVVRSSYPGVRHILQKPFVFV